MRSRASIRTTMKTAVANSAERGRRLAGGAPGRRHLWQDRGGDRSDRGDAPESTRRSSSRARSRAASPHAMPRRGYSSSPAIRRPPIRSRTCRPCGCWRTCPKPTCPNSSVGQPVIGIGDGASRPRVRRQDYRHRRDRRSQFAPRHAALRDQGSEARAAGRKCSPRSSFARARRYSAPAVPLNGVVREGDGTMSVWVVDERPPSLYAPHRQDRPQNETATTRFSRA